MTDDDQECGDPLFTATDATWEEVGREVVPGELSESRHEIDDAFRHLEATLQRGGKVTEKDVVDARIALNRAHRALEQYVATLTEGTGAWDHPLPDIPSSRAREVYHFPEPEDTDE